MASRLEMLKEQPKQGKTHTQFQRQKEGDDDDVGLIALESDLKKIDEKKKSLLKKTITMKQKSRNLLNSIDSDEFWSKKNLICSWF